MSDPTRMTPATGETPTEGPGDGPDWRAITIYSLVGIISVLVIVLLLVRPGDGDRVTAVDAQTTTTASTTTTEVTPATTSTTVAAPAPTVVTTTTVAPTTSTTATSTTRPPATTSTTAASPTTISPIRCTGRTGPNDPDTVAEVFYEAWTVGDRSCAEQVATEEAVETLFIFDGSGADWTAEGCSDDEAGDDPHTDCVYRYEGGWATFEMRFDPIAGWEIFQVRFAAG